MIDIDINNIKEYLHSNILTVTFEKVDGSTRVMRGTLMPENLPATTGGTSGKTKTPSDDVIVLYSVDDNGWRSFRKDLFISAEISE